MYRIAIQILSYNRPDYLRKTLDSLVKVMNSDDKICVIEQSDQAGMQAQCISICKEYENIHVIPLFKNLGQRGATNIVFQSGFFNDCQFVMLSDHDNIFHEPLDFYCYYLNTNPDIWVATGYNSPEHDIEGKDGSWLIKSTARAGHMVFRAKDFLSMMPTDVKMGIDQGCAWFAGLDWWLTHWCANSPGHKRPKIVAALLGGAEHIGVESTWQGKYDDEFPLDESLWMRNATLYDIIKKYPPRHAYLNYQYAYEGLSDEEVKSKYGTLDDIVKEINPEIKVEDLPIENVDTAIKESDFEIMVLSETLRSRYGEFQIEFTTPSFMEKLKEVVDLNPFSAECELKFPVYDPKLYGATMLDGDAYLHTPIERQILSAIFQEVVPFQGKFLEVGCWAGWNLILARMINPSLTDVVGMDPYFFEYPDHNDDLFFVYKNALEKLQRFHQFNSVRLIRGAFEKFYDVFPDGYFDAIYLDGDHRYPFVIRDINLAYHKLKPGGILFGHDSKSEVEVRRAIGEVVKPEYKMNETLTFRFTEIHYNLIDELGFEDKLNYGIWLAKKEI